MRGIVSCREMGKSQVSFTLRLQPSYGGDLTLGYFHVQLSSQDKNQRFALLSSVGKTHNLSFLEVISNNLLAKTDSRFTHKFSFMVIVRCIHWTHRHTRYPHVFVVTNRTQCIVQKIINL